MTTYPLESVSQADPHVLELEDSGAPAGGRVNAIAGVIGAALILPIRKVR